MEEALRMAAGCGGRPIADAGRADGPAGATDSLFTRTDGRRRLLERAGGGGGFSIDMSTGLGGGIGRFSIELDRDRGRATEAWSDCTGRGAIVSAAAAVLEICAKTCSCNCA